MNILNEKNELEEESAYHWMDKEPNTDSCPMCGSYIWLKLGLKRACTECSTIIELKLGDIL